MYRRLSRVAAASLLSAACASYIDVPVETPLQSKIDVSRFRRALVAGFLVDPASAGDVDLQAETVRLLENQLKTRTRLQVLEADRPPLLDALEKTHEGQAISGEGVSREQSRLEGDRVLQDAAFWKGVGEEFQAPLIVSGRMGFEVSSRSGFQSEERTVKDPITAAPRTIRGNHYMERKAFTLSAEFYFVDGTTGAVLHREKFSEEVLYGEDQKVSPLSAYFELMDRLLPNFLGIVSPQRIRGQRVLLR
jgi:hypothetical protein